MQRGQKVPQIFCLTDYSAGKRINKQTSLFTHAFFRITFTNPEQSFWALNLHLRRAAFSNAVDVLQVAQHTITDIKW